MKGQIAAWSLALVACLTTAVALAVPALRPPPAAPPSPSPRRDPPKLSDLEIELLILRIREGDLRAMKGDLEGARKVWLEARGMGEGLWPIREGLGDSYVRAKLHEEAIAEFRTAEPLVPEGRASIRQGIAYKRAESLAAVGRPLEALEACLEVGQPVALRARILDHALKAGDREAALKGLSDHATIRDPRVYLLIYELCAKLGRNVDAAEALGRHCIQVAPWDAGLNQRAVESLRTAKKLDLAIEVCRAWARAVPQEVQAYRLMGDLHREAGREREAIVAYTSIVDIRAGDAAAHRLLGELFRQLKRVDDAIAQYEAARKARPEDQATWTTLVSLYDSKGDAAKSEDTLFEAATRFGLWGDLHSRLVALYQGRITKLKAEGKGDEVRALRRKLADLNVAEAGLFELKVIMTWDAAGDVDMDVYEPGGEHVSHTHPHSRTGGHYYTDNTRGHGPETYTLAKAVPGTYRIGAHLHSGGGSKVTFVVILYEDSPREERREESFILDRSGEQKFIRDIVVPP